MCAVINNEIVPCSSGRGRRETETVPADLDVIRAARDIGTSFGD